MYGELDPDLATIPPVLPDLQKRRRRGNSPCSLGQEVLFNVMTIWCFGVHVGPEGTELVLHALLHMKQDAGGGRVSRRSDFGVIPFLLVLSTLYLQPLLLSLQQPLGTPELPGGAEHK